MPPSIATCLWFDREAEEAVDLYATLFKDLTVTATSRYDEGDVMEEGLVRTITFEMFGQRFTALNGGPVFRFTEAVSIQVNVDTQEEVDRYWNGLTRNGGEESRCGWLKDRFGLSWQIVPRALIGLLTETDPAVARRTNMAMLKMKKLDIAELQRAAGR